MAGMQFTIKSKNYDDTTILEMWKKQSRKEVNSFLETLRIVNQDGIDLYSKRSDNENIYKNQLEYDEYFKNKTEEAETKKGKNAMEVNEMSDMSNEKIF